MTRIQKPFLGRIINLNLSNPNAQPYYYSLERLAQLGVSSQTFSSLGECRLTNTDYKYQPWLSRCQSNSDAQANEKIQSTVELIEDHRGMC